MEGMKGSCLLDCIFTQTTIKIPLKFPAFTFNKPKGWSISASNKETNSAAFIMR